MEKALLLSPAYGWFAGLLVIMIVVTALFGLILFIALRPIKKDEFDESSAAKKLKRRETEITIELLKNKNDKQKTDELLSTLREVKSAEKLVDELMEDEKTEEPAAKKAPVKKAPVKPAPAAPAEKKAAPAKPAEKAEQPQKVEKAEKAEKDEQPKAVGEVKKAAKQTKVAPAAPAEQKAKPAKPAPAAEKAAEAEVAVAEDKKEDGKKQ